MTFVLEPFFAKYSASRQALVFESSPPITTKPSRSRLLQLVKESANCYSVSILCLPLPRRKNDVRQVFNNIEVFVSCAQSYSKQIERASRDNEKEKLVFKMLLTNHIEATCVPKKAHVVGFDFHEVIGINSIWSVQKAEKLRVGMKFLNHVKETHHYVVSTCGLTA